ncbi:glutamate--tRNA ligase [Microbacterium karelineae]|uniref:glutamate--tRNA ligase n=1 Tax=Microbacterium karelineae TaxID=2654283 RepID=UPI0012EA9B50|nr:glutamate--tRNA ligase [Microbacterium karelineae]
MSSAPDSLTTQATGGDVRVRFCPSPTGLPHVGLVRTALFNWAFARHHGGTLVFRIEDTDANRDSQESYEQLIDALTWLGIDWDEGVEVGGPHAPYRQSERHDLHRGVLDQLVEKGLVYESFSTAEEIDARNEANGRAKQQGYDNFDRDLTDDQRAAYRAEGRQPALRLKVPDEDITYVDLIRGEVTFPAGSFSDFVIVRPNGIPLYTFVNPVDDALMGITHVLRGEDLMPSTARQIVLYRALIDAGVTSFIPRFGHMPLVLGDGTKKLSKRDPRADLFLQRDKGFIREGLLNYLALLGWSIAPDRDVFSLDEFVRAFDIEQVNPNPARFDQKKAESINGDHVRMLAADDFAARLVPYLQSAGALGEEPTDEELALVAAAAPLVQERMQMLGEVGDMLGFLFTDELAYDEDAVAKLKDAPRILHASVEALEGLDDFRAEPIQAALAAALIDRLELKPRVAYAAPRVAISGRRVSPPLFESMELLGRVRTLERLRTLAQRVAD